MNTETTVKNEISSTHETTRIDTIDRVDKIESIETESIGAKAAFEFNGYKLNVEVTIDKEFDKVKDVRGMMRFYQEKLRKSKEPKKTLSAFDKKLLGKQRFRKEDLSKYHELLLNYTSIFQSHIATYIPMQQGHILEEVSKNNREFTLEMRLMHRYWKNDSSDAISSKQILRMPKEERNLWHIDECLYLEVGECTPTKMVVTMDTSHLFRKFISPIFLKQSRFGSSLLEDFKEDYAHEMEHASRIEHMHSLIESETEFYALPEDKQKRNFYIKNVIQLVVEEGIANYAVYTEHPFFFLGSTINKFQRKLNYLIDVKNPENYIENYVSKETYENDGAGTYYVGEAACYLIGLLLEKKEGKKFINITYRNKNIQSDELADVLIHQRTKKKHEPILFTSTREQYLPTYKHIHSLSRESFMQELYEAQEALHIRDEDKILTASMISRLEERASMRPAKIVTP